MARSTLKSTGSASTTASTQSVGKRKSTVQLDVNFLSREDTCYGTNSKVLFREFYEKLVEA